MSRRTPSKHRSISLLGALLLGGVSCSNGRSTVVRVDAAVAPVVPRGPVVATVGGVPITVEELVTFARLEGLSDARAALELLVRDRLLAHEARRRGYGSDPSVLDAARRGALQRLLVVAIEEPLNESIVPPGVLQAAMHSREFLYSRPALTRTTHAVAQATPTAPAAQRARARAAAQALHAELEALPPASRLAALRARAPAVLSSFDPRVEDLEPVAADGRMFGTTSELVLPFARAAVALTEPGALAPVVETEFGFHVIVAVEHYEAALQPPERVRATVLRDVLLARRTRALEEFLTQLQTRYGAELQPQALERVERLDLGAGS